MSYTRRRETSDIWKYFSKTCETSSFAVCKFCNASISRGGKNAVIKGFTTTNLWNHLKRLHKEEIDIKKTDDSSESSCDIGPSPKKQATVPQLFESCRKYAVDDPRSKEITRLIAEEICVDMEPLNHVNKVGFQRLIKKICPRYEMVSRTHLTQVVLPDLYVQVKSKVKLQISNISNLCMTSDLWSSDSSSSINDFISVTIHGVDKNFEMKNICLDVKPFDGETHSGELIAQNLCQAITNWEIETKLKVIITDNARNIVNATKSIPNIEHIPCMAHSLQLVLQDAVFEVKDIKDMVTIARKIVGHFSHSTKAVKILRAAQEAHNVPIHILVQDVPTRWDSTYLMLNRLNEQRVAVQAVLPELNISYDLNTQQWILLQQVVQILKYFEEVTKALSNNDTTLADAIPLVNSLFKALELEGSKSVDQAVGNMAAKLTTKLSERLGALEDKDSYILATAVDPRYKLRVFRHQDTINKAKELLYDAVQSVPITETHEKSNEDPSRGQAVSENAGIWDLCQQMIDNVESDEPLSIYASKLVYDYLFVFLSLRSTVIL